MPSASIGIAFFIGGVLASAQNAADATVSQDSPYPCGAVKKEAQRYFESRGIRMDAAPYVLQDRPPFHRLFRSGAPLLDGSGQAIGLNRFGLRKYLKTSLAPLRIYTGFDVSGRVTFTETQSGCASSLSLEFFADEWSPWLIFAEGRRAVLESNKRLEGEWLEGIARQVKNSPGSEIERDRKGDRSIERASKGIESIERDSLK
jgi:hypothetical protein